MPKETFLSIFAARDTLDRHISRDTVVKETKFIFHEPPDTGKPPFHDLTTIFVDIRSPRDS
jgi:hypothetical protein